MPPRCLPPSLLPSRALPPTTTTTITTFSFLTLLQQCSTPLQLEQLHAFMLRRGLDLHNHHLPRLIDCCSRLGLHSHALSLLIRAPRPDLFLLNTAIARLSRSPLAAEALALFRSIRPAGFCPDHHSFPAALKAAAHLRLPDLGAQIHAQVTRAGLSSDAYVATWLLTMYSSCGRLLDARKLFDVTSSRRTRLCNAMMAAYAEAGDVAGVRRLFETMTERDLVSWTTLISVLAQHKRSKDAVRFFLRMLDECAIEPDEVALLAALSACADLGALELGRWIHCYVDRRRLHRTVPLMNALVGMYSKSGDIEKALEVFESMECRSIVSWTMVIEGLALHGLGCEALEMFCRMEEAQVQPNEVSFLAILVACSHSGLVDAGCRFFDSMKLRYGIKPRIEHYGCLVDLLGRAGRLEEARELVEAMSYEPNAAIFGSLLSAAKVHGDAGLGEYALRHLVEVEPHNSGNYSILCNLYASKGNWKAAGNMRQLMRENGVYKVPGGSSIELNGEIHEFISRDILHPQLDVILEVLHELDWQLKMAGKVSSNRVCG